MSSLLLSFNKDCNQININDFVQLEKREKNLLVCLLETYFGRLNTTTSYKHQNQQQQLPVNFQFNLDNLNLIQIDAGQLVKVLKPIKYSDCVSLTESIRSNQAHPEAQQELNRSLKDNLQNSKQSEQPIKFDLIAFFLIIWTFFDFYQKAIC
jgi:hypothetical protein